MTSIRRNLIAYFLLLMAVTLTAAGACVNYFVTNALRAREEVESDRVRREADVRRQDERARFDRALVRDARALADEFRKFANRYRQASPFPPSGPTLDPWYAAAGRLSVDPWHAAVSRLGGNAAPYRDALFLAHLLTHSDDVLTPDHPETDWYQFHLPRGPAPGPLVVVKRSRQPAELPLDTAALEREPRRDDPNYFDEIDVPGHGVYRRVVLRYPIFLLFSRGPPPLATARPPPQRTP